MINAEHYSEEHNFSHEVLIAAFNDLDFYNGKSNKVLQIITRLLDDIKGKEKLLFNTPKAFMDQFCHSCCHALAEYLVNLLHAQNGITVAHIHITHNRFNHSCVEVTWKDELYYIDAEGVFTTLEDILGRYNSKEININSIIIVKRSGVEIINEYEDEDIKELTELTKFSQVIACIADSEGCDSADLEENALNNIVLAILP